jgi:nucleotide-binding universal stress UspA family protein
VGPARRPDAYAAEALVDEPIAAVVEFGDVDPLGGDGIAVARHLLARRREEPVVVALGEMTPSAPPPTSSPAPLRARMLPRMTSATRQAPQRARTGSRHPPRSPRRHVATYGSGGVACTAVATAATREACVMASQTGITHARPTFASILCGVDGSRPSREAARQAALLTDGAAPTYAAISWEQGRGATAVATLSHRHAHECLRQAQQDARELGIKPALVDDQSPDVARRLMELAAGQDLLVLGIQGHSRAGGIMVGSAASAALHRSPVPVLVARWPPEGVEFPSRIVLASDGTPTSDAAAELTARIAGRYGSHVAIVGARDHEAPFRAGLAEHATQIMAVTGTEPVMLDAPGHLHRAVADAARDFDAALVITGSRGLSGLPALRSVSERIAHAAPCSVLVVRSAREG